MEPAARLGWPPGFQGLLRFIVCLLPKFDLSSKPCGVWAEKSENDLKLNVSFARRVDGIGHSRIGGKTPRKSKKPAATGHLGAVILLATHTNLTTCAIRIAPITRQSPAIPEGRRTKINYMVSIPQDIEIVNENILYLVFLFLCRKQRARICLFLDGKNPVHALPFPSGRQRTLKKPCHAEASAGPHTLSRRLYRSGGQCASCAPAAEMPHSGYLTIRGLE